MNVKTKAIGENCQRNINMPDGAIVSVYEAMRCGDFQAESMCHGCVGSCLGDDMEE